MLKFLWISMLVVSSSQEVVWKAKVIDGETGTPVEGVHVYYHRDQSVTDSQGFFMLAIKENVTVRISHIGYEVIDLKLDINNLPAQVFIYPKESNLD